MELARLKLSGRAASRRAEVLENQRNGSVEKDMSSLFVLKDFLSDTSFKVTYTVT